MVMPNPNDKLENEVPKKIQNVEEIDVSIENTNHFIDNSTAACVEVNSNVDDNLHDDCIIIGDPTVVAENVLSEKDNDVCDDESEEELEEVSCDDQSGEGSHDSQDDESGDEKSSDDQVHPEVEGVEKENIVVAGKETNSDSSLKNKPQLVVAENVCQSVTYDVNEVGVVSVIHSAAVNENENDSGFQHVVSKSAGMKKGNNATPDEKEPESEPRYPTRNRSGNSENSNYYYSPRGRGRGNRGNRGGRSRGSRGYRGGFRGGRDSCYM